MSEAEFAQVAASEWERMPAKVGDRIRNVALLIEDDVDEETAEEEGLAEGESLLGIYRGIPLTERGSDYGTDLALPDTITLYRLPILDEAAEMDREFREAVRIVVRETIWHEVGHYFGMDEHAVNAREDEGTNAFRDPD